MCEPHARSGAQPILNGLVGSSGQGVVNDTLLVENKTDAAVWLGAGSVWIVRIWWSCHRLPEHRLTGILADWVVSWNCKNPDGSEVSTAASTPQKKLLLTSTSMSFHHLAWVNHLCMWWKGWVRTLILVEYLLLYFGMMKLFSFFLLVVFFMISRL